MCTVDNKAPQSNPFTQRIAKNKVPPPGGRWWRQPPKGVHFRRPQGGWLVFRRAKARLSGFRRQGRHLYWRPKGRRTSPAQRCFIPPEGGALNPSGRRQPVPDRTLGAQGRQARRRHQPSRRSRVNLREYQKAPLRSRSRPRRKRAPSIIYRRPTTTLAPEARQT